MSKADKLSSLLKRINDGEDPNKLRQENNDFLAKVAPKDVAEAQGRLIESGIAVSDLYTLVSNYSSTGFIPDQVSAMRMRIKDNHILRLLLVEHDFITSKLSDLQYLTLEIINKADMSSNSIEYRTLYNIAAHLFQFRRHMDFEDDIFFPNIKDICNFNQEHIKAEHIYLSIAIQDLYKLISNFEKYKFKDFQIRFSSITDYLCSIMKEHIFIENNIIYPIVFETVCDESFWKYIKTVRDELGYGIFL